MGMRDLVGRALGFGPVIHDAVPVTDGAGDLRFRGLGRVDGWMNVLTGLGRGAFDKRVSTRFERHESLTLDRQQLEDLFEQDDLARRFIEMVPREMIREWVEVNVDGEVSVKGKPGIGALALDELARVGARASLLEAMIWGRLYGGGLILVGADDGQPFDLPINMAGIRKVLYLQALDRWHVQPEGWIEDPGHPLFFQPEYYLLRNGLRVHASRMIRFDGALTPTDTFRSHRWHNSVLEAPLKQLMGYSAGLDGVTTALFDMSITVLAQKGLADAVARKGPEAVKGRAQAAMLTMSMMRMMLIDADGEKFERVGHQLTGAGDILDRLEKRVASAFEVPQSILFGTQQGKLTGSETDIRLFYDKIRVGQGDILVPALVRLLEVIFAAKDGPFRGVTPASWTVKPHELMRPSDKERVETQNKQAQTDKIYVDMGAVSNQEVRESRFGDSEYSYETTLDPAMTAAMLSGEFDDADADPDGKAPLDPGNPDNPAGTVPGEDAPEPDAEG